MNLIELMNQWMNRGRKVWFANMLYFSHRTTRVDVCRGWLCFSLGGPLGRHSRWWRRAGRWAVSQVVAAVDHVAAAVALAEDVPDRLLVAAARHLQDLLEDGTLLTRVLRHRCSAQATGSHRAIGHSIERNRMCVYCSPRRWSARFSSTSTWQCGVRWWPRRSASTRSQWPRSPSQLPSYTCSVSLHVVHCTVQFGERNRWLYNIRAFE